MKLALPVIDARAVPAGLRPVLATPSAALADWLARRGQPAFRAKQIRDWIVRRRAVQFAAMTDLPAELRLELEAEWTALGATVAAAQGDADAAKKLLLRLRDGSTVESVLLYQGDRRTICLSTQVGCGMGCVFCASGIGGVERNLTAAEMIEELVHTRNLLDRAERVSHIVVMGMGEPLANLDPVLEALEFATSKSGLGIGQRNVTISTVGLPAKIIRLANAGKKYHLAVSLHAPNDALRRRIVPTAEKTPLADILAAADEFRRIAGRQVTFEYVLLADVNDAPEHARELAALLAGRDAMINLIPYNPVEGMPWRQPSADRVHEFARVLRDRHCVVKVRKRKGDRIDAACGQLRRRTESPGPATTLGLGGGSSQPAATGGPAHEHP